MYKIGDIVSGKKENYSFTSKIGSAGMGHVFAAVGQKSGKEVAIKFFSETRDQSCPVDVTGSAIHKNSHLTNTQLQNNMGCFCLYRQKLQLEAKILEDLSSSGLRQIIRFMDKASSSDPNDFFYVMEKIEGETLSKKVQNNKGRSIPENEIIRISLDIFTALDSIHKKNTSHRDLKPANIMQRKDGSTVVLDFGTAKQGHTVVSQGVSDASRSVFSYGWTCHHQSLEKFSTQCDLFAIGRIMFYMVTGQMSNDPKFSKRTLCRDGLPAEILNSTAKKLLRQNVSSNLAGLIEKLNDPDHMAIHTSSQAIQILKTINKKPTAPPRLGGGPIARMQPFITIEGDDWEISLKPSGSLIGSIHQFQTCEFKQHGLRCNKPHEGNNISHGRDCPSGCRCHTNLAHELPQHHVRIWQDPQTKDFKIMNLKPDDPSAILDQLTNQWKKLDSLKQYTLQHNDYVALAYTRPPDEPPIIFNFYTH